MLAYELTFVFEKGEDDDGKVKIGRLMASGPCTTGQFEVGGNFQGKNSARLQGHPNLSANILKIMYAENQTKWLLRNIHRPS